MEFVILFEIFRNVVMILVIVAFETGAAPSLC